ncbi:MAG TPA: TonB-dependent receptor, partial [Terriglobales bacterium]
DTYGQGSAQIEKIRSTIFALFAQDSWKIRPNLTLNYGLRWELFTPLTDVSQHVQTFRPGQSTAIYPCELSDASITAFEDAGVTDPNCDNTGVFPTGLVVPGDQGVPPGLTSTYYKTFAPRIGIAYSPGSSGKTSIRAGWGMFYNPIEQLVLEQFSAEPPFGGSNIISYPLFNTPFVDQFGSVKPNPFNGILDPPRGQAVDWALYRPILLYGQYEPHLRTQYSVQYNLNIQQQLSRDLVLQVGYVGSQGHRLLATHDLNFGNPQTCLDMQAIADFYDPAGPNPDEDLNSVYTCGQFYADSLFVLPAGTIPDGYTLNLPYGSVPSVTGPNPTDITLVGLRPYSSPQCEPTTGEGCPQDGVPVFSSVFAQDTIANSNYNSLQIMLEKRFSRGLQLQGAYTWSKSFDQASSFEGILNPVDFRRTYSLSQFDARHRFGLSYYYELPIPKYSGFAGKLLNGWDISGIYTYQTGFPIRITSSSDNELMYSADFEYPGEPDQIAPFRTFDPRENDGYAFDPSAFTEDTTFGIIGNARRTYCCGPPINSFDFALHKVLPLSGETSHLEFRAEFFNLFNHTQFNNPDGNITDGSDFGRILRAKDPRQVQFALKLFF